MTSNRRSGVSTSVPQHTEPVEFFDIHVVAVKFLLAQPDVAPGLHECFATGAGQREPLGFNPGGTVGLLLRVRGKPCTKNT